MAIAGLGYVVIGASDLGAWREYATGVLGCQCVDDGRDGLRLRLDELDWRIAIESSDADDILAAGWEVADQATLDALATVLAALGVEATADPELAARRGVCALVRFIDPVGLVGELFWGPRARFERPFVSPAGVSGFVTGAEGLGHLVLAAPDTAAMQDFYGRLGFRLSDYIDIPGGPRGKVSVTFMHCNARHHTIAFAPAPPTKKLLHMMLQVRSLDDVGFAQDRAAKAPSGLALTLGRHSNDHMVSFYAYTPSGFEVEFGWGARAIDPKTWTPVRHDLTSVWGHAFVGHGEVPQ